MHSPAAVAKGQIISFNPNVSDRAKDDVLESSLLAQLVADKKYDQSKQPMEWASSYFDTLSMVGWVSQHPPWDSIDAKPYDTVDVLVCNVMEPRLSLHEMELFQKTVDACKSSKNEEGMKVFDSSTRQGNKANFTIGSCSNSDGNPLVQLGCFNISTDGSIEKTLFYKFGSNKVEVLKANCQILLNSNVYEHVRDAVKQKLGQNAEVYIKPIIVDEE